MSSCRKCKNSYSRWHDHIFDTVIEDIQRLNPLSHVKMAGTVFPAFRNEAEQIRSRNPDVLELKENGQESEITEIAVCFDVY